MLFVLVMEALNALIRRADELELLTPLGHNAIKSRASLYADDLVVFLHPAQQDLGLMRSILQLFAGAFGLHTNINKCQFSPIHSEDSDIESITSHVNYRSSHANTWGFHSPFMNHPR